LGPFHRGVLRFGSRLRLGYLLGCVCFVANLFYSSFVPFQLRFRLDDIEISLLPFTS
jgi:hypothetical protein